MSFQTKNLSLESLIITMGMDASHMDQISVASIILLTKYEVQFSKNYDNITILQQIHYDQ